MLPLLASADMNANEGHRLAVMALQHDTKAYLRLDVAAHRGDAVAMNWLGAYWESRGDSVRARKDYLRASAAGNGTAALNLGYLYRFGHGVPKDMVRAVVWYRRAAHLGNAHALAELGNAYYLGQGVHRDRVRAYLWYWLATRQSSKWRPVLDALGKEIGPLQVNRARDAARAWLAGETRP